MDTYALLLIGQVIYKLVIKVVDFSFELCLVFFQSCYLILYA